ncbi:MAG: phage terminase large subunit [Gemmatimonadota bacterium]|nr:phage terminase large subunit [Gemmatimonadota bacterium]
MYGWKLKEKIRSATDLGRELNYFQLTTPGGKVVGLDPLVFRILRNDAPIFLIDGGRKSGKSWAIGQALILMCSEMTEQYRELGAVPPLPVRVLVIRESVNSLENSVVKILWARIEALGFSDHWTKTKNRIKHKFNGSEFVFQGLKAQRHTAVRSYTDFDFCWIEEGQEISPEVWTTLEPTIRRRTSKGNNGRFLITMNRSSLNDALDKYLIQKLNERRDVVRVFKNYMDCPFLNDEDLEGIEIHRQIDPAKFRNVWLGEPDMEGQLPLLINARMVEAAFAAYRKHKEALNEFRYPHTLGVGGLDLAGMGENFNCFADRRGPVLRHMFKWNKTHDHHTYRIVFNYCTRVGCGDVHFDESGVGQGFASRHVEAMEEHHREYAHYPLKAIGQNNGAAVAGKEVFMSRGTTNEGYFQYRGDQMGQILVVRLENTQRLLDGVDVPLENCLFFSDELDPVIQTDMRRELTQPTVEYNKKRQMHIKKLDKTKGQESPDTFDALRLSYAPDSEYGIKMSEWS